MASSSSSSSSSHTTNAVALNSTVAANTNNALISSNQERSHITASNGQTLALVTNTNSSKREATETSNAPTYISKKRKKKAQTNTTTASSNENNNSTFATNNNESVGPSKKVVRSPSAASTPSFASSDLECIVCRDLPPAHIFQCTNGHLMCLPCYDSVVESAQSVCPACRDRLPRERRWRNRFAEQVLASLLVPCKNTGCGEKLTFAALQKHEIDTCGHRGVVCKYSPVGCEWQGVKLSQRLHEKTCTIRRASVKSILKRVIERERLRKLNDDQARAKVSAQIRVSELIASRCRDVCVRDVIVEKDAMCNDIGSPAFRALGCSFDLALRRHKVKTSSEESVTIGLALRLQSSRPKRLPLIAFLMKGPDSDLKFMPLIQKIQFSKKTRSSEIFELPLDEDKVKDLFEMGSLNVRVGLIDRRRGCSRNFANSTLSLSSIDSDSSDSSGDDLSASADETTHGVWAEMEMDDSDLSSVNLNELLVDQPTQAESGADW